MTAVPASNRTVTNADNFGDGAAAFAREIEAFVEKASELAAQDVSETNEGRFTDLVNDERRLRKHAGSIKEHEKRPFLDECARIDATFNATIDKLAAALKTPKAKHDAYLIALDEKREAAAREAREAAARAAAEAREIAARAQSPAADPFERFDAAAEAQAAEARAGQAHVDARKIEAGKTKSASYTGAGRAVSVRTTKAVEVEDYAKAFAAVSSNKTVREAIDKAVNALAKVQGYAPIEGCRIVEAKVVR